MNFSSIIGFLIATVVLVFAVHEAEGAKDVLLNIHAVMIVFGGTAAATFVCFPIGRIAKLSVLAIKKIVGMGHTDYGKIIKEVIELAEGLQKDPSHAKNSIAQIRNPFLKEGVQLYLDGVTEIQLSEIMSARIETIKRRYSAEVGMFRTIGKFPPAFGLLGTTFGMIALLNKLGGTDAQKMIGPAMAVGLVATLYGIALTNFLFIPISENLAALGADDYAARKMVLDGLIMIKRKTHPLIVEERMKSYLLPAERESLKKKSVA